MSLQKALYGKRSERSKLPRLKLEAPPAPENTQQKRRARAAAKAQTPTLRIGHDARVPLENNASETALRRVALVRKNYLFVGDVDSG